ncbi:hypothetical protein ACTWJ8_40670 (plasmid) [Streptomyces sp. SDT5-1]|uniref:hypothetical protein n=1 Tax=Streptomyces sp. SDT5-1 TaxID=3406418 RepID=UPI003FD2C2CA
MSQRSALILFIGVVFGIGVGVLTFFAEKSYPAAVLAGVFAVGPATAGLHRLIA